MNIFKKLLGRKPNARQLGALEDELENKDGEVFKKTNEFKNFAIDGIKTKPLDFINDRKSNKRNCFLLEKPEQRIFLQNNLNRIINEINRTLDERELSTLRLDEKEFNYSDYLNEVPSYYTFTPFSTMGKLRSYPFEINYSTNSSSEVANRLPYGRMQFDKSQNLINATLNYHIGDQLWNFKLMTVNKFFHVEKIVVSKFDQEVVLLNLDSKLKSFE